MTAHTMGAFLTLEDLTIEQDISRVAQMATAPDPVDNVCRIRKWWDCSSEQDERCAVVGGACVPNREVSHPTNFERARSLYSVFYQGKERASATNDIDAFQFSVVEKTKLVKHAKGKKGVVDKHGASVDVSYKAGKSSRRKSSRRKSSHRRR